ncbi:tetratricopeptide repeat protein [Candidatus Dojkabacteria bacterium]|nr:tetratricopeptide repeat protein [Candidatus Dojkabacteria bacterium]
MTPEDQKEISENLDYAYALYNEGKYKEVIDFAEKSLKQFPKTYEFLDLIRNSYYPQNNSIKIRETQLRKKLLIEKLLKKTKSNDPEYPNHIRNLRYAYDELHQYKDELKLIEIEKSLCKNKQELNSLRSTEAYCYEQLKKFDKAQMVYKELSRSEPLVYTKNYITFLNNYDDDKENLNETREYYIKQLTKNFEEFPNNIGNLNEISYQAGELLSSNLENKKYVNLYSRIFTKYFTQKEYSYEQDRAITNLIYSNQNYKIALKLLDKFDSDSLLYLSTKLKALKYLNQDTSKLSDALYKSIQKNIKDDNYDELKQLSIFQINETAPKILKKYILYMINKSPSQVLDFGLTGLEKKYIPYKECISTLNYLLTTDKTNEASIRIQMASLYQMFEQYDLAAKEYEKSIQIRDDYFIYDTIAQMYANAGNKHMEAKFINKYIFKLEEEIKNNPDNDSFITSLAYAYKKIGKYKNTEKLMKKALNLSPNSHFNYSNLAYFYYDDLKSYSKAIEIYQKFLNKTETLSSKNKKILRITDDQIASAYFNMARAYEEIGKQQEALKCYDKAIELEKQEIYYYYKAKLLKDFGDLDMAIYNFNKCLEISPNSYGSLLEKGNALLDKGKLSEAQIHYRKCLKLNPEISSAYTNMSVVYSKKENYKKAIEWQRKSIKIDKTNAVSWNNLQWYLLKLGKKKESERAGKTAIKYYEIDISKGENRDFNYFSKAEVLVNLGRFDEARKSLIEAIKINPLKIKAIESSEEFATHLNEKWMQEIIKKYKTNEIYLNSALL